MQGRRRIDGNIRGEKSNERQWMDKKKCLDMLLLLQVMRIVLIKKQLFEITKKMFEKY